MAIEFQQQRMAEIQHMRDERKELEEYIVKYCKFNVHILSLYGIYCGLLRVEEKASIQGKKIQHVFLGW